MLLITCPVTHTDELVADRRVRAVADHPTHVALTVACPCGRDHVFRTGRRFEEARARLAEAGHQRSLEFTWEASAEAHLAAYARALTP